MACHRTLLSRGAALGVCLAVASAVVFAQPAGAPPSAAPAQPSASSARAAEKPYSFTLKPVVIDTASSSGAALGLDYELKGNFKFGRNGQTSVGSQTLTLADVEKTIVIGQLDLLARGTIASSKEKNPNKLLDFSSAAVARISAIDAFYKLGGRLAFETDQSLENRQLFYGLSTSASKIGTLVNGDAGSILLNYGVVNPAKDPQRKAAAGDLDNFKRWDAEASYSYPVFRARIVSVDFNYRHYQETSAPSGVKAAGLDRNRLGLIRLNLDEGFFIQYSRGSLPFDTRSERSVKLGWSLKLDSFGSN